MTITQLRGFIFDMDGVLVDSHAAHRKAWRTFFQTLGLQLPEAELDFIRDGRKREDILRHFLGDLTAVEIDELGRRKDCIFRQVQLEISPVPGVVAMVRELYARGAALALATCASRSRALSTLTGLDLLQCFRVVVTAEDVVLGKPDPGVYRLASERLGLDRRSLLAFEDAISGVRAAVAADLVCIGVARHETPKNLCAAGAFEVLQDFEAVSADHLEGILLRGQAASHARDKSALG